MNSSEEPFKLHLVQENDTSNPITVIRLPKEEFEELWETPSPAEVYQLALESIFRWTLRRDELTDTQIVRAIKKVTTTALGDW